MKKFVTALVALGLAALYVASCTATTLYTATAISHLRATQYADGEQVQSPLPVLVVIPTNQPSGHHEIHSVSWRKLPSFLLDHPHYSFHLPDKQGELPARDSKNLGVQFRVTEQRGLTQVIEVTDRGDPYTFYSRYEATGKTISPRYFRVWAPLLGILGLPVGLGVSTLLFYGMKRFVRARLRTLAPDLNVRALGLSQAATEWLFLVSPKLVTKQPLSS